MNISLRYRRSKRSSPYQRHHEWRHYEGVLMMDSECTDERMIVCADPQAFKFLCERSIRYCHAWLQRNVAWQIITLPRHPYFEHRKSNYVGWKGDYFSRLCGDRIYLGDKSDSTYSKWRMRYNTRETEKSLRASVKRLQKVFASERDDPACYVERIFSGYKQAWVRYYQRYVMLELLNTMAAKTCPVEAYDPENANVNSEEEGEEGEEEEGEEEVNKMMYDDLEEDLFTLDGLKPLL